MSPQFIEFQNRFLTILVAIMTLKQSLFELVHQSSIGFPEGILPPAVGTLGGPQILFAGIAYPLVAFVTFHRILDDIEANTANVLVIKWYLFILTALKFDAPIFAEVGLREVA